MAERFEWQTEAEDAWLPQTPEPKPRPKWRAPLAIGLLAIAIVTGLLLVRASQRRQFGLVDQTNRAVLDVHTTLEAARARGDIDLFVAFLNQGRGRWREIETQRFQTKLVDGRVPLGLRLLSDVVGPPPTVTLTPDGQRADVISTRWYEATNVDEPIALRQLTVYAWRNGRWWRTSLPRSEDFWGAEERTVFGFVTAVYPGRDGALGRRLGQDLARHVEKLCALSTMTCPERLRLNIIFSRRRDALLNLHENVLSRTLSGGYERYHVTLPSPTLVGLPIDETGYKALLRGYTGWVTTVLLNRYHQPHLESAADFGAALSPWGLSLPPMPLPPGPAPATTLPGSPWPASEVWLACNGDRPARLLAYQPDTDRWRLVGQDEMLPPLTRLLMSVPPRARFPADGQGRLQARPSTIAGVESWRAYLWLGGQEHALTLNGRSDIFLAEVAHATAVETGRLTFYPFMAADPGATPLQLDLHACLRGDCALHSQTLLRRDHTPARVTLAGQTALTVTAVLSSTVFPGRRIVAATDPSPPATDYVLVANAAGGVERVLVQATAPLRLAGPPALSPAGDQVAAVRFNPASTNRWEVVIRGLGKVWGGAFTTSTGVFHWSPDGRWLLLPASGRWRFVALATGEVVERWHGLDCHTVGWLPAAVGQEKDDE